MSKILEALTTNNNQLENPSNPDKVSLLKQELEQAQKGFDSNYEYSDDHSYWKEQKDKANKISSIKKQLRDAGENITESKQKTISVLTEARTYKLWESAGRKIMEAELTQDQIQNLFKSIETTQTDSGANRTLLGKGKDAASAVNKAWEDLKTKVQNSGPIKNVDAMYDKAAEQLKQATGGDQGVMKYVQKYRDFAQKHPVAQSLIYSALIAAAGISGAGLGGAAALGLFKMVDKLLQGEKFSSAAYSGAKTGAMAYGASKIGDMIKGKPEGSVGAGEVPADMQQGLAADQAFQDRILNKFPPDKGYTFSSSGDSLQVFDSAGKKVFTGDIPLKTMDMKTFAELTNNGQMATPGISSGSISSDPLAGVSDTVTSKAAGAGDVAQSVGSKPPISVNLPGGEMKFADQAAYDAWQNGQQLTQVQMPGGAVYSLPQTPIDQAADAAQSVAQSSEPIDYTKPGPTSVDSMGQKLEYGIPINDKGSFVAPNPNLPPEELAQQTAAYNAWKQNFMSRFPEATLRPDGTMQAFKPGLAPMFPGGSRVQETVDQWKRGERLAQTQPKKLSESQIYLIIGKVVEKEKLKEGIMDTVKGAAEKAADWAATKGKNLTTKVTADKLLQAWKKAGSPTDSLDVAKVIQNAGVPSDTVKQVYGSMKIPFAGEPGAGPAASRDIPVDAPSGDKEQATTPSAATATTGVEPQTTPAAATTTPASTTGAQALPGQTPQQVKQTQTSYQKVKSLVSQLDKRNKQRVLASLQKELQLTESELASLSDTFVNKLILESKKEADYGADYQDMVKRVGQMAAQGPRKTVYDPEKRVYKTVPVNPPKEKGVAEETNFEESFNMKIEELEIVNEDWQKVNRKDKTSGMSRKAVKAYRRENPGSKLQTAVTTKPSKLKKGSKSAKRRKSFCARMKGMKKSRTSAKTKRDPNSNINKALRRWNCESVQEMQNLVMIAEAKIKKMREAANPAQQAAIAISMKKAGKKPKSK